MRKNMSKVIDAFMAIKVSAPNDPNGNPRRGWMIVNSSGETVDFVDEGYQGNGALKTAGYPRIIIGPEVDVSPATVRALKKQFRTTGPK